MVAMGYFFFFLNIFQESTFNLKQKQKYLWRNIFGSPHTSNRISLLRNFFSSYVYIKNVYITSKGIVKFLFVLVLRIFLICRFLYVTAVFTEKIKLSKFECNFPFEKVNFSLAHPIHTIHSFWRTLLSS